MSWHKVCSVREKMYKYKTEEKKLLMLNFIQKYQYEDMTVFTILITSVHRKSLKAMIP